MKKIQELAIKSFIGIIIFCFISLTTIIAYGYINNLGGKNSGQQLSKDYWNNMVINIDEIKNGSELTSGAINSFELSACPTGWTEYIPARGRFIRGIDSTGTNDSVRLAGDIQLDDYKRHLHAIRNRAGYAGTSSAEGIGQNGNYTLGAHTANTGGAETRPKNVALLFCQKN